MRTRAACFTGIVSASVACITGCSSGPGEQAGATSASVSQGVPIVGLAGKCLDAAGGSSANGTQVRLWTCNGTQAQAWTLSNGQILGPGGKCLDAAGVSDASGTPLQLWDCWGGPNQQWSVKGTEIVGMGGKCMDVRWAGTADGTPVQLWDCNGTPAQQWTVGGGSVDAGGPGDAGGHTGPCAGASVFCDDYTSPTPPSAYHTVHGTWTRQSGDFMVTDSVQWERARAVLAGDYGDFDVTIGGRSLGDAGFGLVYAASDDTHGYAVLVHPAQFQGVYLKQLVPGSPDVEIHHVPLPTNMAGQSLTLRVRRTGTQVTVWLNGAQLFTADDGGVGAHGQLGILESTTDDTSGSGTSFTLLRLDEATAVAAEAGAPPPSTDAGSVAGSGFVPAGYDLVFSDEFNGASLDTGRWMLQLPCGCSHLNDEIEHYTNDGSNVSVGGGTVTILGKQDLSSGVFTGQASFKYGYFELRAKMAVSKGAWPAYWLTSDSRWPPEWDVFELVTDPSTIYETPHPVAGDTVTCDGPSPVTGIDANTDFHVYGLLWTPTDVTWFIDGQKEKHCSVDAASSSDFMWLIHNMAIGGQWPGDPDSTTQWPLELTIDYSRVYQDASGQIDVHAASGPLVDPASPQ